MSRKLDEGQHDLCDSNNEENISCNDANLATEITEIMGTSSNENSEIDIEISSNVVTFNRYDDKLQDINNVQSDMETSSGEDSDSEEESNTLFGSEEESGSELIDNEDDQSKIVNVELSQSNDEDLNSKVPLYVVPPSDDNFVSPINYDDHVLAVSTYAVRHNISDTAFEHLLYLIDIHIPENNLLERRVIKMKEKCGFNDGLMKFHTFCTHCENVFSNGVDACQTPFCPGKRKTSKSQHYFVTGNLQNQLENVLVRKDIWNSIQEQSNNVTQNITDIVDGIEYKKLKEDEQFLSCTNNISLAFFTDGVALFKSSGISLWPVYLLINELPRRQRFLKKNMILWGVWQGTGKPRMSIFLKSLVKDLQDLYKNGITLTIDDTQICCRAMMVVATMDLPARAAVLHMTQYNGEYSCIFCMDSGQVVKSGKGHCRSFPYKSEPISLRTNEDVIQNGKQAQQTNKRVKGFTGISVFNYLPNFSLCNNTVIDYMHGILLGICKKLLFLWFNATSYEQPYFIGHLIKDFDKYMKNISPPYLINRLPRKLSNTMHHWKASEIRSWLLFYALPCLLGKLPDLYLKHFSTLVEATYLLLGEGVSNEDLERAELLLTVFVKSSERLYGQNFMGLNVHSLLHVVTCVKNWGPLWAWSCFCFESFNGEIKKSIHGTGNVCKQIFWSLHAEKHIENMSVTGCNQKMEDFLNELTSGKLMSEENCKKAYQCTVLNAKDISVGLQYSEEIIPVLANFIAFHSISEFLKASKIIRNGYVMYSKMCTKVKKRNSYCVKLIGDEEFFEVEYFLYHKTSLHVFAVGRKLCIVGGVLNNRVPHIKEVKLDR